MCAAGNPLSLVYTTWSAGVRKCLHDRLGFQRINLVKDHLQSLLQLLFSPWFAFCLCKLSIICDGAPVKIGSFAEQFNFLIILYRHFFLCRHFLFSRKLLLIRRTGSHCRLGRSIVPWCFRSWLWSQTSSLATREACFFASSAFSNAGSWWMANRWPHLPQTTVSIEVACEECSALRRRRLAMPLGFTSGALGAGGSCRHGRRRRHREIRRRRVALVVLLH